MELDPFFAVTDDVSVVGPRQNQPAIQSANANSVKSLGGNNNNLSETKPTGVHNGSVNSDAGEVKHGAHSSDILDVLSGVENPFAASGGMQGATRKSASDLAQSQPEQEAPNSTSVLTLTPAPSTFALGIDTPSSTGTAQDRQEQDALDHVWTMMAKLLTEGQIEQKHVSVVQGLFRENLQSKEKISKLKSLLQRSSKAQKEAKAEAMNFKQRLDESQETIRTLHARIDTLANRPTHYLDLVADFESNFDRALLAMEERNNSHYQEQQHTGEASVEPSQQAAHRVGHEYYEGDDNTDAYERGVIPELDGYGASTDVEDGKHSTTRNNDSEFKVGAPELLASELQYVNQEREKLEGLNAALLNRASKLEKDNQELREALLKKEAKCTEYQMEVSNKKSQITNLQMALKDRTAALTEMQLEIDLVTRASVHANARASEAAMQAQQHSMRDQQQQPQQNPKYVSELEAKVTALTEWAMASAASKQLAVERVGELEERAQELSTELHRYKRHHLTGSGSLLVPTSDIGEDTDTLLVKHSLVPLTAENFGSPEDESDGDDAPLTQLPKERRLWKEASSMVIGAGMAGSHIAEIDEEVVQEMASTITEEEIIVLRWKFDLTPSDMDIYFSIFKGKCQSQKEWEKADALVRNKRVVGGGGGDVEGAFVLQNACTLVWSNSHSWIRPRTVKFTVEAVAFVEV